MTGSSARAAPVRSVMMGEIDLVHRGERAHVILGSCVGIILLDPARKMLAVAHVMLPEWKGASLDQPGKYANTAVPALLDLLRVSVLEAPRLRAIIAGGANMFGAATSHAFDIPHVGQSNIEQAKAALAKARIPVVRADTGGFKGRRIDIGGESLEITISVLEHHVAR